MNALYVIEVRTTKDQWEPTFEAHYVKRKAQEFIAPLVAVMPGRYRIRKYVRAANGSEK